MTIIPVKIDGRTQPLRAKHLKNGGLPVYLGVWMYDKTILKEFKEWADNEHDEMTHDDFNEKAKYFVQYPPDAGSTIHSFYYFKDAVKFLKKNVIS